MNTFKKLTSGTKATLTIQAIAMLMGASTHVAWAVNNGFLSQNYNAPLPNTLFWDSLTFLDPLAAILLFTKPKAGLILTLLIILVDVTHNNVFYYEELYTSDLSITEWVRKYWMILGQILFAIFALLTFKRCLKDINSITSTK